MNTPEGHWVQGDSCTVADTVRKECAGGPGCWWEKRALGWKHVFADRARSGG